MSSPTLEQLAIDWTDAVLAYCASNGLACPSEQQMQEFLKKAPFCTGIIGITGLEFPMSAPYEKGYMDKLIGGILEDKKHVIALTPHFTVNGKHPGSNIPAGTYNLSVTVITPLSVVNEL